LAINALLEKNEWQQRRAACRLRIQENFSLERMCSRYRQAWDDVASSVQDREV